LHFASYRYIDYINSVRDSSAQSRAKGPILAHDLLKCIVPYLIPETD